MGNHSSRVIISLGGSLIVPEGIDVGFLKKFKRFIDTEVRRGKHFIIVTGGGSTARNYQKSAGAVVNLSHEDLDWLGIHATKLNAHLMRTLFRETAYPVLSKNPERKFATRKPVIIASGWKPGWSTDYVSVKIAETYGIDTIINLSNIDYAYTKDPKRHRDAKKINAISWGEFQKIVGTVWKPGSNVPFDPIATKLAKKLNLHVFIARGGDLANLKNLLSDKPFKGTHIYTKK